MAAVNDPRPDVRPDLRASDSDREQVADVLRRALAEGRLDLAEYDDRMQAVYAAKTHGELTPITADLPMYRPVPPPAAPPPPARRFRLARHWRRWAVGSLVVTAIWLFSIVGGGGSTHFWPIWVIGPWGLVLTIRTFGNQSGRPR